LAGRSAGLRLGGLSGRKVQTGLSMRPPTMMSLIACVELTLKLSTASMPRARPSWRQLRTTMGCSSKGELNGQVVNKLKTARRDGTTHVVMSPLELMQRPAAPVPRPRLHLIRLVAGRCEQPDAAQRRPCKRPGSSSRWSREPCSGRHGEGKWALKVLSSATR